MLPDVVRDEMQICVAYLVVVKREEEEEEEEEEVFFVSGFQESSLQIQKKIFIACTNAARLISLVRARYARPAQNTFFIKVSPQLRVSAVYYESFWSSSPERTRERGRREEKQKNNERKTSLERESVFKKHQHDL